MSIRRYAAKRDKSESEIVEAMRGVGASVLYLSMKDAPDVLIGFRGRDYLAEIKTGKGKVRPGQAEWHENWQGSPVLVLRNVDEALQAIGAVS